MEDVTSGLLVSSCMNVCLVSMRSCCSKSLSLTTLIGFTPFACEDRHNTKLKILKHNKTLRFPEPHESPQPVSLEAFDLMQKLLTEKEYRLCTRRYELNDYTRKFMGVSYHLDD